MLCRGDHWFVCLCFCAIWRLCCAGYLLCLLCDGAGSGSLGGGVPSVPCPCGVGSVLVLLRMVVMMMEAVDLFLFWVKMEVALGDFVLVSYYVAYLLVVCSLSRRCLVVVLVLMVFMSDSDAVLFLVWCSLFILII